MSENHMRHHLQKNGKYVGKCLFDSSRDLFPNFIVRVANKGPIAVVGTTSNHGVLCGIMSVYNPSLNNYMRDDFAAIFDSSGAHFPSTAHPHDTYHNATYLPTWGGGHCLYFGPHTGGYSGAYSNAHNTSYPTWIQKGTLTVTKIIVYSISAGYSPKSFVSLAYHPGWHKLELERLAETSMLCDSNPQEELFDPAKKLSGTIPRLIVNVSDLNTTTVDLSTHAAACNILQFEISYDADLDRTKTSNLTSLITLSKAVCLILNVRENSKDLDDSLWVVRQLEHVTHVSISWVKPINEQAIIQFVNMERLTQISFFPNDSVAFGINVLNATLGRSSRIEFIGLNGKPPPYARSNRRNQLLPAIQPCAGTDKHTVYLETFEGFVPVNRKKLLNISIAAADRLASDSDTVINLKNCRPILPSESVQQVAAFVELFGDKFPPAKPEDMKPRKPTISEEELGWIMNHLVPQENNALSVENIPLQHVIGSLISVAALLQIPRLIHLVYAFEIQIANTA